MDASQLTSNAWHTGQQVRLRGKLWRVRRADSGRECIALTVVADALPPRELTVLVPFDRPEPVLPSRTVAVVRPRRWRHALDRLDLATTRGDAPDPGVHRDMDLLPWQLEPLLALLCFGASRVLIADAVGMGKTVQAGLVLAELARRSPEFRALVVAPAGLRLQWQRELAERFALDPVVADAAWLRASTLTLPPGLNCWARPGLFITSMDFLKRPEVLASLEALTWTAVIVDEAHLATAATDRRVAIDAVCARAEHSLLLTATPHSGDARAFRALCGIGRLPHEPPPLLYSRQRQVVSHVAPRRSSFRRVRVTADEHRLHGLLAQYTKAVWARANRREDGDPARLVALVLRKRALSGSPSLLVSVERRLTLMRTLQGAARPHEQPSLPLDDGSEDAEPTAVLGVRGLDSLTKEIRWLEAIAEAARRAARHDSKERWLRRFVTRVREPMIVFTEYRDTLSRLSACLASTGRHLGELHGGLDRSERDRIQQSFNHEGFVLLATDAAAEGLNLHRRCRLVVHYELPWRPGRLVQRTGRVDRLGQERRVHEIALVTDDTAEQLVLLPLARHAVAAGQAGPLSPLLTESQVAAFVFDEILPPPGRVLSLDSPSTLDLGGRAAQEAQRLDRGRPAAGRPGRDARAEQSPIFVTRIAARAAPTPAVYLVFAVTCSDVDGLEVHSELVVLCLAMDRRWNAPLHSRALRALSGALDDASRDGGPLDAARRRAVVKVLDRARAHHRRTTEARRQRLLGMVDLRPGAARRLVQPGLFDGRALRAAASADADGRRFRESVQSRLEALRPGRLDATTTLRAVLVVAGSGS